VEDKADKTRIVKTEKKEIEKREDTKGKNKEFRKLTVEEEIKIVRIVEEKQKEEEDLIKIRMIEEMVPRRFHKYLKVFEKKDSKRMLIKKI